MEIWKKWSIAAYAGALVLSGIVGNSKAAMAYTEGTYEYKGNTAQIVIDIKNEDQAYFAIHYPIKTSLSVECQLYVLNDNGDGYEKANCKKIESGSLSTTMLAGSLDLASEYKDAGKKIERVQVMGNVSGTRFKNEKNGKTFVEESIINKKNLFRFDVLKQNIISYSKKLTHLHK